MKTERDPRHQARRLAVSVLYSYEIVNTVINSKKLNPNIIQTAIEGLEINSYNRELFKEIIFGVSRDYKELKKDIEKHSIDWDLSKIFKIDMSILMVAIWEIKNHNNPIKVIIDEAVELAKEFGESDSPKFINGILAGVVKNYDSKS